MRREEILVFLATDKLYIYSVSAKKEKIIDLDTSQFFQFGEISDVEKCEKVISRELSKMDFKTFYLKPNYIILYNDIARSDTKFLYRSLFREIEFNTLAFVPLSKVARRINKSDNLVIFDKNYYTLVNRKEKCKSEDEILFDPIIIGKSDTEHIHYSDSTLIWKEFKTYFTNSRIYDNIEVGDDES